MKSFDSYSIPLIERVLAVTLSGTYLEENNKPAGQKGLSLNVAGKTKKSL